MKEQILKYKQKGVFSIELALVAVFFSLFLVFSGDIIIKLSVKGKLDRLSYSLVNIIKERTQLYPAVEGESDKDNNNSEKEDTDLKIDTEVNNLYKIAKNSLTRTMSGFDENNLGILVEKIIFNNENKTEQSISVKQGFKCNVDKPLTALKQLLVVSTWGKNLDLYRVTLCYETEKWLGSKLDVTFTTVTSSSVMVGR